MRRSPKILTLSLLTASLFGVQGCSDDCKSPFDCAATEVCAQGTCTPALNAALACASDNDCGGDNPVGGMRAFICVAGRCQANPGMVTTPTPDSGVPADTGSGAADTGVMMTPDTGTATNTPDAGTPPDTGPAPDAGMAPMTQCVFPNIVNTDEDNNAPMLSALTLENTTEGLRQTIPEAGDQMRVNVSVVEADCGMDRTSPGAVSITITGEQAGQEPPDVFTINAMAGPRTGNVYEFTGEFTVGDCLTATPHIVSAIRVVDLAGNVTLLTANTQAGVYQQSFNGGAPTNTATTILTFTPSTLGSPLSVLQSISAAPMGNGVQVDFGIDNGSCAASGGTITLTSTRGQTITRVVSSAPPIQIDIPDCARSGTWAVSGFQILDEANRAVNYAAATAGANYVRAEGALDSMIAQVSADVMGGAADATSPQFAGQPAAPMTTAIANSGTAVDLSYGTSADGCMVQAGTAILTGPGDRVFTAPLTAANDMLTGCVPIPACAPAGTYTVSLVNMSDEAGSSATLTVVNNAYTGFESDLNLDSDIPNSVQSVMHP